MARRLRRAAPFDAWPGYVDALSTLLMVVIFVLLVFVLGQGFLASALSGRDRALAALERQLAALSEQLRVERAGAAALRAEAQRREQALSAAAADGERLARELAELRAQLARLVAALDVSEARVRTGEARLADLQARLDAALLARVEELQQTRSEFYARLRGALGDRPELRVVGDRFVFQAELLFPAASAELSPAGQAQLRQIARLLGEIAPRIPPGTPWILRVDGHADRNPIRGGRFADNWQLSAARALAVVQLLIEAGVPANRLAATAFGDQQPLEEADTPEAHARNRRIELRLTDR
ncbi:OmpA family protein [Rubritepida flocculans]|uniref:OmpA family protein n=1 Tax=Rubritepida flocculans TaxID=182403 RepID=UPI0004129BCA|nr:OmpA family protein [Rubritepida flocculans]